MGTGEATRRGSRVQARQGDPLNPLLDEISLKGAEAFSSTSPPAPTSRSSARRGGERIARRSIRKPTSWSARPLDPEMAGMMRVSVVATSIALPRSRGVAAAMPGQHHPAATGARGRSDLPASVAAGVGLAPVSRRSRRRRLRRRAGLARPVPRMPISECRSRRRWSAPRRSVPRSSMAATRASPAIRRPGSAAGCKPP